jgi:zinc transporter ZupT
LAQLSAYIVHRIAPHSMTQCACTPTANPASADHSHSTVSPVVDEHTALIASNIQSYKPGLKSSSGDICINTHSVDMESRPTQPILKLGDCINQSTYHRENNDPQQQHQHTTTDQAYEPANECIIKKADKQCQSRLWTYSAATDIAHHATTSIAPIEDNTIYFCNHTKQNAAHSSLLNSPVSSTPSRKSSCCSTTHAWQRKPHSHSHSHHHHHHDTDHSSSIAALYNESLSDTIISPRMAIQTALAVALHKLPEGMITFIGANTSASLGWSLLVAILVHNIPDGLAISVPVYTATGSRWRAFWAAALLGGLAQPLGALIGMVLNTTGQDASHSDRDSSQPHSSMVAGIAFAMGAGVMMAVAVLGAYPAAVSSAYTAARQTALKEAESTEYELLVHANTTSNGYYRHRLTYWQQRRLGAIGTWLLVGVAVIAISMWMGA